MRTRVRLPLLLLLAIGMVVTAGCRRRGTVVVTAPAPPPITAADLPVELTYPQSDDQGHYVALRESGSHVVAGIVASPSPPTRVLVNGIPTRPYGVEHITPYGYASPYPVYRFHAPVVLAPSDRLVVQVVEPVVSREVVFMPDGPAVITRYHTLVTATPSSYWLNVRLGNAYYADLQYANSVSYLNRAVNYDRQPAWALFDLGMAYLSWRRANDALRYFNRGLVYYPAFPDYYYGRGMVYYTTRRYTLAIGDFNHCGGLAPYWGEPVLALGMTYDVSGRWVDSERVYHRAIGIWPYWAPPRYALATVLVGRGDVHGSIVVLRQAERLGPWRPDRHLVLAQKLHAKGRHDLAWRQVQIARSVGGKVPEGFRRKLAAKGKDPGKLREEPWRAMRGPGPKREAELPPGVRKAGGGEARGEGGKGHGGGGGKGHGGGEVRGEGGKGRGGGGEVRGQGGKGRGGIEPRGGGGSEPRAGGGKQHGGGGQPHKGAQVRPRGGGGQARGAGGQPRVGGGRQPRGGGGGQSHGGKQVHGGQSAGKQRGGGKGDGKGQDSR